MIRPDYLEKFRSKFRGSIVLPEDDNYNEARKIYNAMIDKRPALIAYCSDVADVIYSVNFARENKLLASIRGGGHNGPGLALCDGGLVLDISRLNGIRVDPDNKTARVGAGCVWGDVDHATHPFGLAASSGIISTTGVAGLTLGGGHGYLSRKYGLTIDNLLAADVVLADGSFVKASSEENEDLFWALRGGGGNFGVVTSFLFKLHPVSTVYGGPTFWPIEKTAEAMRWYKEFIQNASDDLYGFFAVLQVPADPMYPEHLHNRKMCGVVWCYTGPIDKAEDQFKPIKEFGPPEFEHLGPMPFPALQSAFDKFYPPGLQLYWKGDFFKELPDEAIEKHAEYASKIPTPLSTMHLYLIDRAVQKVAEDETAWSYRDAVWSQVIVGVDPDPSNNERMTRWAKDYWKALHPYSCGGGYVNFMMEEGEERIRATYQNNYDKLVKVKNQYDPTNFFRVNQNIKPS
jgi:FAD/FMN-containing dehydrogenase